MPRRAIVLSLVTFDCAVWLVAVWAFHVYF
jgi:hypothetical protein